MSFANKHALFVQMLILLNVKVQYFILFLISQIPYLAELDNYFEELLKMWISLILTFGSVRANTTDLVDSSMPYVFKDWVGLVWYLHLCCQFLELCFKMKMYKNDCRIFYSSLILGGKKFMYYFWKLKTLLFLFYFECACYFCRNGSLNYIWALKCFFFLLHKIFSRYALEKFCVGIFSLWKS